MKAAIAAGEIELTPTAQGKWMTLEELMAKALETWPREVIEEALGADAETVLPEAERLIELRARIPQYQLATLQQLAHEKQTTLSDVLTRELDDLVSAHAEALAHAILGLRDALG
jgi:hypothetical protein